VCAAEGNILAAESCIKIRGVPFAQQLEERLVIEFVGVIHSTGMSRGKLDTDVTG
jgi:hypothetical protein